MQNLVNKIKLYGLQKSIQYGYNETIGRVYRNIIKKSYSQKGEDVIIDKILGHKKSGSYIDVGAFSPFRLSNTKRFYDRGWRGVNIEPDYNNYLQFVKYRPKDTNLNIGVSPESSILTFFRFNVPTLSTFSATEAEKYKEQGYILLNTIEVEVKPLSTIFSEVLKQDTVDFLSIDTEGYDMEVLRSNDWNKYRPKVICIETAIHSLTEEKLISVDIIQFLKQKHYKELVNTGINTIFIDDK